MDKFTIGNLAMILGGLLLSIQIYGLKIIQCMEKSSGSWWPNMSAYATEGPVLLSLFATGTIIVYGIVLTAQSKS